MPLRQCCGITKKGYRCAITTFSRLKTGDGTLASQPLLEGRSYCFFHGGAPPLDIGNPTDPLVLPLVRAPPCSSGAAAATRRSRAEAETGPGDGIDRLGSHAGPRGDEAFGTPAGTVESAGPPFRVVYFDLETVSIADDPEEQVLGPRDPYRAVEPRRERVVEFGAVCASSGAVFQQLVWPGGRFAEPHVTGITNSEVWRSCGGDFPRVFSRFCDFLRARPRALRLHQMDAPSAGAHHTADATGLGAVGVPTNRNLTRGRRHVAGDGEEVPVKADPACIGEEGVMAEGCPGTTISLGAMERGAGEEGSQGPLLLVAHNGHRFDVQVLYRECQRHGVDLSTSLGVWSFCDSLELVDLLLTAPAQPVGTPPSEAGAAAPSLLGQPLGCRKLQCLARDLGILPAGPGAAKAKQISRKCRRSPRGLGDIFKY